MQLYYHPISGHCHRAHLFLALLQADYELIEVDLKGREHKSDAFLKLNPFGQIPVLVDGETVIADSNAILVYLAKKFGRTDWLPEDAASAALVQRWLSVAAGQVAFGPAAARLITLFNAPFRPEEVIGRAHDILALMNSELASRPWIVGRNPTIADIALYSYVARAPEGGVDLSPYQSVGAWLKRVEDLPGFVPFVETPVASAA
ncbi:glutathione S-transferase [Phyllobacterium sp. 21LDTY02-6]|uniref:glutathione S-transferase family protein n=1 Tax=Phyllobacterium sp. 21LDTY02-6 TaxID=2944903 RepID=UPI0020225CFC|nr:glutathione S-transferase [Phyllobacterium sp. 21LDTY02-6]MCO4319496.1 glutathione S-transferase [Phyllobacterium sp. 21LDTY02-6]